MSKKQSNFLMQGSILALAAMISKVIGLAYRIPLTNILGDEGNGYYGVVFQAYNLALMLTSFSLPTAVSKLVSERLARKEYKNVQKVMRSAMTFGLIAGGLVALIVFFGANVICTYVLKMELGIYALRVLSPCILIVAVLGVLRGYFQGHSTMIPTAISQVLEQIVNAVMSIIFAYSLYKVGLGMAQGAMSESYGAALGAAGGTVGTVSGAFVAMLFLILIYVLYQKQVKKQVAKDTHSKNESTRAIYKVMILTILPIILSATLYNVTNILDQAVFTNIMSAQGFTEKEYTTLLGGFNGQYDTLMGIPASVAAALAASFIPSLVSTIHNGTKEQIYSRITLVCRFIMMVSIPCAFGFIFLGRPILDLMFWTTNNTLPAAFLRIGGISVIFLNLSTVTTAALQGLDKMTQPVKNAAIALVIHLIALILMMVLFKLNIYAVVISKVIFAVLICVFNAIDIYKACGYKQEMKQTFMLPGISAIVMTVFMMIVYKALNHFLGNAISVIIAVIIAVMVYAVTMVVTKGVTETELMMMPKGSLMVKVLKKVKVLR